ncbi:MAG: DUF3108 domain-containing protein [Candidatus Omnitrophica bacterium]|nr:DUF3108 domain-containing protein [Candidatus Omnitrophota bacterium]
MYYHSLCVGKIKVRYSENSIGKDCINTLILDTYVRISPFLHLIDIDKIYTHLFTNLPLKVERKVKFRGKEEDILEEYDQEEGEITITYIQEGKSKVNIFKQTPPIHNPLEIFFLYVRKMEPIVGNTYEFNLPLIRTKIFVEEIKEVKIKGIKYSVYIMKGEPKNFVIWLDKNEKIPLRVYIPLYFGKVIIEKDVCK